MPLETFVAGIVVALALGAALAALWFRTRTNARAAEDAARTAADSTRPIAETLARIETQIREVESQRQHMMGSLEHQLGALSRETVALSQAMRAPNTRGRWGELTLRRVAELAGMAPQCDFFEQQTGGEQRPDMIVKLPGGRSLAVDAKVPLSAYLDAEACTDPAAREAALVRHAQQVSRHLQRGANIEVDRQLHGAIE